MRRSNRTFSAVRPSWKRLTSKAKKLRDRLDKAPELVVYELTSPASQCSQCHAEILQGSLLFLEQTNLFVWPAPILTILSFCPAAMRL